MNAVPARDDEVEDYVSSALLRENVAVEGNADEI